MVCASITIEPFPGAAIETVSGEACDLATRLNLCVEFKFNGVKCMALPHGDPQTLADNWLTELRSKNEYKVCSSNPRPNRSTPMTQSERRDMFAAAALTGLLANVDANGPHWQGHLNAISAMAFKHADAMIAASKEKDGE